jgi:hypothetical protein
VRKFLAAALIGVGVFGLVLAGLLRFWAPSHAKKTPLNLNITQVATGDGQVLNAQTGKLETFQLRATRIVRTDSTASDSTYTTVNESLCVVKVIGDTPGCVDAHDPQKRLVSLTTDRVTADRKTAESVNIPKYKEYVDGNTTVKHVGVSYKFPFDAKKQTYKFFDPASLQVPDAKYIGKEKLEGLNLYKYEAVIDQIDLPIAPGIPGKYADTRTVWVDPLTGVIVKGVEHQVRTLADGSTALDTTLTFDEASIKYQAKQAKDGHSKINQLTVILPILGIVIGIAAIVGGLMLGRRSNGTSAPGSGTGPVNAGAGQKALPRS